jgi:geranylgeranyl transferase type-1 subunit beta
MIGVQGRVGKDPDSCYSFWVGASLKMLTGKNLLNLDISKFIMSCFKRDQKSFSKYP